VTGSKCAQNSRNAERQAWPYLPLVLILATGSLTAAATPQRSDPLPCVPAASGDTAPWNWESRILESFPPDTPRPAFAGAFGDKNSLYRLDLWRDSKGIFGELRNPVLEADSPTSRLYDPRFDPKTGAVSFTVRLPGGDRQFTGTLRSDSVTGMVRHAARSERVTLRKLRVSQRRGAIDDFYTSRAKFECAMILFRRY